MVRMAEWEIEHRSDDVAMCDLAHREELQRREREEAAILRARPLNLELLQMIRSLNSKPNMHRSMK